MWQQRRKIPSRLNQLVQTLNLRHFYRSSTIIGLTLALHLRAVYCVYERRVLTASVGRTFSARNVSKLSAKTIQTVIGDRDFPSRAK
jgi:hypothetical protein